MRTQFRIPAARFVSELCIYFVAPSKQRAQGMPGAGRTRSLACKNKKQASIVTTGQPKSLGTPCAMVLRLLRALPGVSGLLASVARGIITRELDPSVEGTGPHGLTVRTGVHRLRANSVHRIPPHVW